MADWSAWEAEQAKQQAELEALRKQNLAAQGQVSSTPYFGGMAFDPNAASGTNRGALSHRNGEIGYYTNNGWVSVGAMPQAGTPEYIQAVQQMSWEGDQEAAKMAQNAQMPAPAQSYTFSQPPSWAQQQAPQDSMRGFQPFNQAAAAVDPAMQAQAQTTAQNLKTNPNGALPDLGGSAFQSFFGNPTNDPMKGFQASGQQNTGPSTNPGFFQSSARPSSGLGNSSQAQQQYGGGFNLPNYGGGLLGGSNAGMGGTSPSQSRGTAGTGALGFQPFGMNSFFKSFWGR